MNVPEMIVGYIQDNPGCIKNLYYSEEQSGVDESALLDPCDWQLLNNEKGCWMNTSNKVISGYWDVESWVDCDGWCDGIVVNIDTYGLLAFHDGTRFDIRKL